MNMKVCDWNTMCSVMSDRNKSCRDDSNLEPYSALVFFNPVESGWPVRDYTPSSRCYRVSSEEKFFDGSKCGNSLSAYCVDLKDADSRGIRLDYYLDRWVVDFCVICF